MTLMDNAMSALNGRVGVVELRVKNNPVTPDENVSVPTPDTNVLIVGSVAADDKLLVLISGVVPPPKTSNLVYRHGRLAGEP